MSRKVFSNPEMEVNEEYAAMSQMVQEKFRFLETVLGRNSDVLHDLEELVSSMSILENEVRTAPIYRLDQGYLFH